MTKLYLSEGNTKLKKSAGKKFLIWSIPSCQTCPFKTALCEKYCYAKKSERMYPSVKACRATNFSQSLLPTFVKDMIALIESFMNKKTWLGQMVYFRIHESGDFYNMEYFEKWIAIAKHFENNPNIVFAAYTKSLPYYDKLHKTIPANLVIRASIWADTKQEQLDIINKYDMPYFTALSKDVIEEKVEKENLYNCVGDCGICKVCYSNHKKIACLLH